MANYCDVTVYAVGNDAGRVSVLNKEARGHEGEEAFGGKESVFESKAKDDDGDTDYLVVTAPWQPLQELLRQREAMAGEGLVRGQLWITRTRHVQADEAAVWVEGWRKWAPPALLVEEWSRRFPDLRFYLGYNVEGQWDSGVYEFVDGASNLVEHRVGWFRMVNIDTADDPVHHYVARFEDDNSVEVKRLADAKRIFRPKDSAADQFEEAWAFRCAPEELLKEGVKFAWGPRGYTLDEAVYLGSVWEQAMNEAQRNLNVCACPVRLTYEERRWLVTAAAEPAHREEPGCVRSDFRCQQSLDLFETPDQLALLLTADFLVDARREEIRAAMQHPGWTKKWPAWQDKMAAPPADPQAEAAFMDELAKLRP